MDLWSFNEKAMPSNYDPLSSISLTPVDYGQEQILNEKKEVDLKFETIRNKLDDLKYDAIRAIETQNLARKFHSSYNELKEQRNHLKELSKNSIRIALELYKFTEKDVNVERKFSDKIEFLELTLSKLDNNEIPEIISPISDMFHTRVELSREGRKRTGLDTIARGKIPRLSEANGLALNLSEALALDKPLGSNSSSFNSTPLPLEQLEPNNNPANQSLPTNSAVDKSHSPPDSCHSQYPPSQADDSTNESFQNGSLQVVTKPTAPNLNLTDGAGLNFLYSLPHGDVVSSLATANLNGETIFTGGLVRGAVKLWDSDQNQEYPILTLKSMESYIRTCGISPNGKILVVGGESDKIVLWDISESPPFSLACYSTHSEAIYAIAFTKDSNFMFSCCSNGTIIVWDLLANKSTKIIAGHSAGVTCVDVTPDGCYMITGSLDKTVRVWDLTTFEQVSCCILNSPVFSLGLGFVGQEFEKSTALVIVGLESSNISTLSFNDLVQSSTSTTANHEINSGHEGCITSIRFSPKRDRFLSTDKSGLVLGWRLAQDGRSIYRMFAHHEGSSILSSAISSDGTKYFTGSGDKLANSFVPLPCIHFNSKEIYDHPRTYDDEARHSIIFTTPPDPIICH